MNDLEIEHIIKDTFYAAIEEELLDFIPFLKNNNMIFERENG